MEAQRFFETSVTRRYIPDGNLQPRDSEDLKHRRYELVADTPP